MDEDWVVLCQTPLQSIGGDERIEMYEKLQEVCKHLGEETVAQKVTGLGKVAWRNTHIIFLRLRMSKVQAFGRRSALRESRTVCISHFLKKKKKRFLEIGISTQATGGANGIPHRTHFSHAIFSRVWIKTHCVASCVH